MSDLGYVFVLAVDVAYSIFLVVGREEAADTDDTNHEGLYAAFGAFVALRSALVMLLGFRREVLVPAYDQPPGAPSLLRRMATDWYLFHLNWAAALAVVAAQVACAVSQGPNGGVVASFVFSMTANGWACLLNLLGSLYVKPGAGQTSVWHRLRFSSHAGLFLIGLGHLFQMLGSVLWLVAYEHMNCGTAEGYTEPDCTCVFSHRLTYWFWTYFLWLVGNLLLVFGLVRPVRIDPPPEAKFVVASKLKGGNAGAEDLIAGTQIAFTCESVVAQNIVRR